MFQVPGIKFDLRWSYSETLTKRRVLRIEQGGFKVIKENYNISGTTRLLVIRGPATQLPKGYASLF